MGAVEEAVRLYRDSTAWHVLMTNGLAEDFSWDRSAKRYLELYRSIVAP